MNKQRKVLITVTYNEMGIIIDTKAEEIAQPEPKWIPCSERLPETSGMYLVDDCRFGTHWIHTAEYVRGTGLWCEQIFMHAYSGQAQIVAWMPLPEPYKERREE